MSGSLTFVGTGLRMAGQVTQEALEAIRSADKLFHIVQDVVSDRWLSEVNATAESLYDAYAEGKPRQQSYEEMVDRILAPVREGLSVCVALYGHPGVLAKPAHVAIQRARKEGLSAEMLPGVSADACLFADLGVDPGAHGCQSFEATDFLVRDRRFDSSSALILWQIGGIGIPDFRRTRYWNPKGVAVLADHLTLTYGANHEVVVYEAAVYPIAPPTAHRSTLQLLAAAPITSASTLYVPPLPERPIDARVVARLAERTPS